MFKIFRPLIKSLKTFADQMHGKLKNLNTKITRKVKKHVDNILDFNQAKADWLFGYQNIFGSFFASKILKADQFLPVLFGADAAEPTRVICKGMNTAIDESKRAFTSFSNGAAGVVADLRKFVDGLKPMLELAEFPLFKKMVNFFSGLGSILDPFYKILTKRITITIPWPVIREKRVCVTIKYPCGVKKCFKWAWYPKCNWGGCWRKWFKIWYPCGVVLCSKTGCAMVKYPWITTKSFGTSVKDLISGVFNAIKAVTDPLMNLLKNILPSPPKLEFPNPLKGFFDKVDFSGLFSFLDGTLRVFPKMPDFPKLPSISMEDGKKLFKTVQSICPTKQPRTKAPTKTPTKRPTNTAPPTASEACTGSCVDYRGVQDTTRDGKKCQKWTATSPHNHNRNPSNYPNKGLGDQGVEILQNTFQIERTALHSYGPDPHSC